MPLGPYEDFGQCVQAQKMKGKSDESARAICGKMQADIEGEKFTRVWISTNNLANVRTNAAKGKTRRRR